LIQNWQTIKIQFIYSKSQQKWFNTQLLAAKPFLTPEEKQLNAFDESQCKTMQKCDPTKQTCLHSCLY
jgi:hypothetical protein